MLAEPDVAQAAETALRCRARQHRCRVLALGGGDDHLHVVFSFPDPFRLTSCSANCSRPPARRRCAAS